MFGVFFFNFQLLRINFFGVIFGSIFLGRSNFFSAMWLQMYKTFNASISRIVNFTMWLKGGKMQQGANFVLIFELLYHENIGEKKFTLFNKIREQFFSLQKIIQKKSLSKHSFRNILEALQILKCNAVLLHLH
eukprot:TRINITY_DN4954_c0_g2_i3.p2 TRINITY_DN4954_c0_g2~~TRINITY_DN4954_c0_g2_i3.p2  ORF type:complete len:147 (+),score=4.11 TRINITY_DN4954_c0_g2_i3:44-442(+)